MAHARIGARALPGRPRARLTGVDGYAQTPSVPFAWHTISTYTSVSSPGTASPMMAYEAPHAPSAVAADSAVCR